MNQWTKNCRTYWKPKKESMKLGFVDDRVEELEGLISRELYRKLDLECEEERESEGVCVGELS